MLLGTGCTTDAPAPRAPTQPEQRADRGSTIASPPVDGAASADATLAVRDTGAPGVIDERTGLRIAPGFEEVAATCTGCHSARLITMNRASRESWDAALRWMQRYHNLWKLEPQLRDRILDYLAANYGVAAAPGSARRQLLPAHLRPPTAAALSAGGNAPVAPKAPDQTPKEVVP